MENSIEEDIKILKNMNDRYTFKDCDICNNYNEKTKHCDKHKCMELQAIEHILSDYKRVLKENEELKEDRDKFKKALGRRITYCNELEKDLFENSSNYVIKKQKVKDKIEEYKACGIEEGDYHIFQQEINALEELLREE